MEGTRHFHCLNAGFFLLHLFSACHIAVGQQNGIIYGSSQLNTAHNDISHIYHGISGQIRHCHIQENSRLNGDHNDHRHQRERKLNMTTKNTPSRDRIFTRVLSAVIKVLISIVEGVSPSTKESSG